MKRRYECALKIAAAAGAFLRKSSGSADVSGETVFDVKLKQDTASEEIIILGIEEAFPGDGYISEEAGSKESRSGYSWIIDPLDGTFNYYRGIPHCCVSIACRGGNQAFGIVYDFFRDEMFRAMKDSGAFLNDSQINVSGVKNLQEAIISFGFMKSVPEIKAGMSILSEVACNVRKIRVMGAAALDLCYVAAGRTDIFLEIGLADWDVAAGAIIVAEAGGKYAEQSFQKKRLSYADNGRLPEDICKNLLKT